MVRSTCRSISKAPMFPCAKTERHLSLSTHERQRVSGQRDSRAMAKILVRLYPRSLLQIGIPDKCVVLPFSSSTTPRSG